jgi:hypothetical protein
MIESIQVAVRGAAECGCCRLNEEAVSRVATYMWDLYKDCGPEYFLTDKVQELMNELYLFCLADREMEVEKI